MASFTVVTVVNLFALQSHEALAVKSEEFIHGLSFNFPDSEFGKNPLLTAIATFGIIGVGAAELLAYPYWCMEKGYAKFVGPRDQSAAWLKRAKGWIKVMKYDAWGAMLVYILHSGILFIRGCDSWEDWTFAGRFRDDSNTIHYVHTSFWKNCKNHISKWCNSCSFLNFFIAIAAQTRLCLDLVKVSGIAQLIGIAKK